MAYPGHRAGPQTPLCCPLAGTVPRDTCVGQSLGGEDTCGGGALWAMRIGVKGPERKGIRETVCCSSKGSLCSRGCRRAVSETSAVPAPGGSVHT